MFSDQRTRLAEDQDDDGDDDVFMGTIIHTPFDFESALFSIFLPWALLREVLLASRL